MTDVPGFDDVLAMLKTRPGMWKPLATAENLGTAMMLSYGLAAAAEARDPGEIYMFEHRQTDNDEFTVFGRFDGPQA